MLYQGTSFNFGLPPSQSSARYHCCPAASSATAHRTYNGLLCYVLLTHANCRCRKVFFYWSSIHAVLQFYGSWPCGGSFENKGFMWNADLCNMWFSTIWDIVACKERKVPPIRSTFSTCLEILGVPGAMFWNVAAEMDCAIHIVSGSWTLNGPSDAFRVNIPQKSCPCR